MRLMFSLMVSVFACMSCIPTGIYAQESTTLILVRHAEKVDDSTDPELSEKGVVRAEILKDMLSKAGITAVYSTDFIRTRETCSPTARFYGLPVNLYSHRNPADLDEILARNVGGVVLVCGHSNSTPRAANHYLGQHRLDDFDESDYGNLLILNFLDEASPALLHIRY